MMKSSKRKRNSGFWAFEQKVNGKAVQNCMNMRKGDTVLFVFVYSPTSKIKSSPSNIKQVQKAFSCTLKSDYFIDKDSDFAGIFEGEETKLNDSQWPHYIEFDFVSQTEECQEYTPLDYLGPIFAESYNQGTPIPLAETDRLGIMGSIEMVPYTE
jgi:hypothetical protein